MKLGTGVAHDIVRIDRATGGVHLDDALAVLVEQFRDVVDEVVGSVGRRDQVHRPNVESVERLGLVAIGLGRYGGRSEEDEVTGQLLLFGIAEWKELDVHRGSRLGDRCGRDRPAQERSISGAIRQHVDGGLLRGVEWREVLVGDTVRLQ